RSRSGRSRGCAPSAPNCARALLWAADARACAPRGHQRAIACRAPCRSARMRRQPEFASCAYPARPSCPLESTLQPRPPLLSVSVRSGGGGRGLPGDSRPHEQEVELAPEAIVEDRVQEGRDECQSRRNDESERNADEVQHHTDDRDDEPDPLGEGGGLRVFEVRGRRQAWAYDGGEQASVRVPLYSGERAPGEQNG